MAAENIKIFKTRAVSVFESLESELGGGAFGGLRRLKIGPKVRVYGLLLMAKKG